MRVLVTGARGFIGRHCVAELVAAGHEVHGLSSDDVEEEPCGVAWHRADLLSVTGATDVLHAVRPTHLIHLAWITTPGEFWSAPANDTWLLASRNLVRDFASCGGERVVVAGTGAEYDWSGGLCDEGTTPLRPGTLYGRSKDALRTDVQAFADANDLSWAWGRIFWLYGPGEPLARLVPSIITSLLRNEPARCTAGTQIRDFMYVADVGAALAQLGTCAVEGPVNIASGEGVAIADIARRIGDAMGKPHLIALGARPTPEGDPPLVVAATQRLREEVGFAPRIDLDTGLARTIDAVRAGSSS